jgi:hypothetical protein
LNRVSGSVVEVGVYRGGTLRVLAETVRKIRPSEKVIAIDTFEGHPYSDGHPVHFPGKYKDVELEPLMRYFDKDGLLPWIEFHKGKVEDILPDLDLPPLSFAHVDCDLYRPVRYCAGALPSRMKQGSMIYFDDYGHAHCPGATKAVDEIFPKNEIHEVFLPKDNTNWSCFINI